MSLKDKLDAHWKTVDEALACLCKGDVLPVGDKKERTFVDAQGLREEIRKLREGQYTIAVCGEVKAGKSTLLNALLFGDNLLPAYATPVTAVLTFISHAGGHPRFEIEFYDKATWTERWESYDETQRKELEERIEKSSAKGINLGSYVCAKRRRNYVGTDFKNELREYIAAEGVYTPFVQTVHLYYDHPVLENLRIVDTPGLNDSSTINSEVTCKWVREAHAVVFVLKPQGASIEDVAFFQSRYPSTPSSRLFVQNQIDDFPEEWSNARNAMREYGRAEPCASLGLFGRDETICSYSALAVLIQKKLKRGIALTSNEQYKLDCGNVGEDFNGDPDDLEGTLAEKLFRNAGQGRLARSKARLADVYTRAISQCEAELETCKRKLDDCGRDAEYISQQIEKQESFLNTIEQEHADRKSEFSEFLYARKAELTDSLNRARREILDRVWNESVACGGTDKAVKMRIPTVLRTAKEEAFRKVRDVAAQIRIDMRKKLKDIKSDLEGQALTAGITDKIVIPPIPLSVTETLDLALEKIDINGDTLYDALPGRFWKWLTRTTEEGCADQVKGMVEPLVNENVNVCKKGLVGLLDGTYQKELDNLLNGFAKYSVTRQQELEERRRKQKSNKNEAKSLEKEKNRLEDRKKVLKDEADEMARRLEMPL
jgi:hypothetical protein